MSPTDWEWVRSFGRVELGLSDDELGRMTPRQWNSAVDRWKERERRWDRRFALVAWVSASVARSPDAAPLTIDDFMPVAPPEERRDMTAEEMLAAVRVANAALGGKVV